MVIIEWRVALMLVVNNVYNLFVASESLIQPLHFHAYKHAAIHRLQIEFTVLTTRCACGNIVVMKNNQWISVIKLEREVFHPKNTPRNGNSLKCVKPDEIKMLSISSRNAIVVAAQEHIPGMTFNCEKPEFMSGRIQNPHDCR